MTSMKNFYVSEVMTENVTTASIETPLKEVVHILHSKRFSCLIVTDDEMPVGIITERDMVRILSQMLLDSTYINIAVQQYMTSPIITVGYETTLYEAVQIASEKDIRHIPVVDLDGKLAGLLTQSDIVEAYCDSGG